MLIFCRRFSSKVWRQIIISIRYVIESQFNWRKPRSQFLGGSLSVDAVSKDKKWSAVTGVRYQQ
jgi:hypothetical protein